MFSIAVLAGHPFELAAAPAQCQRHTNFFETQMEASTTAFHAKVVEAEQVRKTPGSAIQGAIFQVLNPLIGRYRTGALVHITVNLTHACSGPDCLVSMDVGDEMLVFSPGAPPHAAPMFLWGCWEYKGIIVRRVLLVSSITEP
jgi:hypothetical protein